MDEFQAKALRTAAPLERDLARMVYALGLAGEAGEVADLVKKEFGHGHPVDLDKILKELGDVLYYVAVEAAEYGFFLSEVATANVDKLRERYPDGFTPERSLNRS